MPELPEVETIRRDLSRYLLNRKITSVNILSSKIASPAAKTFQTRLAGQRIKEIARRGKLLIFRFSSSEIILLIHLKMTGQLIYLDKANMIAGGHSLKPQAAVSPDNFETSVGGELPNKYTRAVIEFEKGGHLFFNDLRKFGYLKLVSEKELEKLLRNNYGPEPLTSDFSLAAFEKILESKATKIKALLLNQKMISGLGNIYVDESLWSARIDPRRPAGSLKAAETKKLWTAIQRILKLAIENRGTTFNNYVDSQGKKGNYSRFLKVYGRKGEKCPNCQRPIVKAKVAGRGTHYCAYCQK